MPEATIVISTKDRRVELRTAVASALEQHGDIEVLVLDDGSSDGTSGMLSTEFPGVRVIRSAESRGYIVQRNRGAELAQAPIIISIDDDATLPHPDIVRQTLLDFDHPRIGAVAIPFIDLRWSQKVLQRAPTNHGLYLGAAFIGTAYAVRRDLFLQLGGFREELRGYWEETDFALKMLDRGYVVRLGRAAPMEHRESPNRDNERRLRLSWHNAILVACLNVPLLSLPGHLAWLVANGLVTMFREQPPTAIPAGIFTGFLDAWRLRARRTPVSRDVFRLRQRIWRAQRVFRLEEVEADLPRSVGSGTVQ